MAESRSKPDNPVLNNPAPYVGLRSFTEQETSIFYGRELESRQLTSLVIAHSIVLFYAQSGAGKTSLLRASVVPALQEKRVIVLPVARVTGNLTASMTPANVGNIFVFNTLMNLAGATAEPEQYYGVDLLAGLTPYFSSQTAQAWIAPRLLILDQFEEIFTQHAERANERADFFRQLQQCLKALPQLSILLTLREDYIAHLDRYAPLFVDRLRIHYRMEPLSYDGALAAVKEPAAHANRPFDAGVAETLVNNLYSAQSTSGSKETISAPPAEQSVINPDYYIEPVYLQIVCKELWEKTAGKSSISSSDLTQFGNVDLALMNFYESAIQQVLGQTDVRERNLRQWVNNRLITPARTRGLVYRGDDSTEGLPNAAIDLLDKVYIIRAETRGNDRWYELAHDRLVEPVIRANMEWLARYESPFADAARRWDEADRAPERLLMGNALAEAQAFATQRADHLNELENKFLAASLDAAAALRRGQRNRFLATISLLTVVTLLAALGWVSAALATATAATAETAAWVAQVAEEKANTAEADAQSARAIANAASTEAIVQQERAINILSTVKAEEADRADVATRLAEQTVTPTFIPAVASATARPTATPETEAEEGFDSDVLTDTEVFSSGDSVYVYIETPMGQIEQIIENTPTPITITILNTPEFIMPTITPLPYLDATVTVSQQQNIESTPEPQNNSQSQVDELGVAPFQFGVVESFGGAKGDFLLRDPNNELSGIIWIPVGTPLRVLGTGRGTSAYGSGVWYFVEIDGLIKQTLQGWLPAEIIEPDPTAN